jgi:hypothetical protein
MDALRIPRPSPRPSAIPDKSTCATPWLHLLRLRGKNKLLNVAYQFDFFSVEIVRACQNSILERVCCRFGMRQNDRMNLGLCRWKIYLECLPVTGHDPVTLVFTFSGEADEMLKHLPERGSKLGDLLVVGSIATAYP